MVDILDNGKGCLYLGAIIVGLGITVKLMSGEIQRNNERVIQANREDISWTEVDRDYTCRLERKYEARMGNSL